MKFAIVVLACLVAVAQGQRASAFGSFGRQPSRNQPFRSQPYYPEPSYTPAPAPTYSKASSGDASSANIVKSGSDISPDGSYNYFFETDNGIAAQAQGTPRDFGGNPPAIPDVVQGSFSYTSPEGQRVVINYVADENGFQPVGDVIPTPPPIPAQIARALEYIARNGPQK